MALLDFFDPTTWKFEEHEHRIYADDFANDYAVVDFVDYQYLIQWCWKLKKSRASKGTKKPKVYLARSDSEFLGPDEYIDGKRIRNRITRTIYLHTVVMERTGIPKPKTNQHLIVDHADGDSFNCRRSNLRWATLSFNARNRFGCLAQELI